jgi:hypothetical protein
VCTRSARGARPPEQPLPDGRRQLAVEPTGRSRTSPSAAAGCPCSDVFWARSRPAARGIDQVLNDRHEPSRPGQAKDEVKVEALRSHLIGPGLPCRLEGDARRRRRRRRTSARGNRRFISAQPCSHRPRLPSTTSPSGRLLPVGAFCAGASLLRSSFPERPPLDLPPAVEASSIPSLRAAAL